MRKRSFFGLSTPCFNYELATETAARAVAIPPSDTVTLYIKKELKKLGISKANVTVRNFPERVDSLRKKYKIKEGGKDYLFFTTDKGNKKIAIHCVKV